MASNPPTDPNPQAALTILPTMLRDGDSEPMVQCGNYSYVQNKTGNQTIKGSTGFLYSVTVNAPVSSATITILDGSTTIGILTFPAGAPPVTVFYNCVMSTSIIMNPSSATLDFTVTYR